MAHAQVEIDERHLQSLGVVRGGVYGPLGRSDASHATAAILKTGRLSRARALEPHELLPPGLGGMIRAEATRLHRGRTTWVWDVSFTEAAGALCATSRITVAVRPAETA